ncbi:MAG: hypothetical protein LM580_02480, partial [Thermofilum sp.]|nr:hypothetical protein [Thermofilum sp.]
MAAAEARVEVPAARRVPISHIVILVLATWLAFVWGYVTRVGSGAKYWVVAGAWLPFIYILALAAIVGRRTGKIFDKTLLIAMLFAIGI